MEAVRDSGSESESSEEDKPLWNQNVVQQVVAKIAGIVVDEQPDARDGRSGSEGMADEGQPAGNSLSENENEVLAAEDIDEDAVLDEGTTDDLVAETWTMTVETWRAIARK